MTDLQAFLQYLVTIELLGLAVFPLMRRIFKDFPDQGWGFSKIMGLVLVSWVAWLAGILGVAPFTQTTLLVITTVVAATSFALLPSKRLKSPKNLREQKAEENAFPWKLILLEEFLFILAFAVWSYLRTFAPDIHGLEKYMDYGFMLSILRAKYFPPLDHYLAGETINYYYFGHLMAAVMTQLSHVPSQIAYNLQMNMLFGLTVLQSFVLGSSLYVWVRKPKNLGFGIWDRKFLAAGGIASFFVALAGNLHTIIYWPLRGKSYWYPDATRFIENTIHEFPLYSFVVNDLHGHVADLPVVLLIIGLLFAYLTAKSAPSILNQESRIKNQEVSVSARLHTFMIHNLYFLILPIAFIIGTTYATNAWDFMIYLVLAGWVFLLAEILSKPLGFRVLVSVGVRSVVLLGLAMLFMLPFWLTVKPVGQGVGIVPLGKQSPPWQWLVLWGHLVLFTVIFAVWVFRKFREAKKETEGQEKHALFRRIANYELRIALTDFFVLVLMFWSLVLILLPEIIFVRDIYPTHYRANTMFKFGYQAFIMFGISLGYVIVRLWNQFDGLKRYAFRAVAALIIFAVGLYPIRAIDSGFNGLRPQARKSLDGTAYLETLRPADAAAIEWLNQNIAGQPTIAEAVGESYTDYARVAANTGIPTVMGWPVHEWLWRGSYSDPMRPVTNLQKEAGTPDTVATRVEDMRRFYETESVITAAELIDKYKIDYVYVGELEREKYENLSVDKFESLGQVAYENAGVKVYRVSNQ